MFRLLMICLVYIPRKRIKEGKGYAHRLTVLKFNGHRPLIASDTPVGRLRRGRIFYKAPNVYIIEATANPVTNKGVSPCDDS